MKNKLFYILSIAIVCGCHVSRPVGADDGKISVNIIQINDVYEIAPLENGKSGGMARVATLKKKYLAENPNTMLLIAGDFLSPSVYNSLKYQQERVRGKQMVEAMNAAGMDLAVFGNHEFDITEQELQSRINESGFKWVSTNTFHKTRDTFAPFEKQDKGELPEYLIRTFTDADGTTVRIGFLGVTLPFNKASYVHYTDPMMAAMTTYRKIKDSCDAVIAVTHQSVQDDEILAAALPGITWIAGGHEHDMRFKKIGSIYITKAHANAKSAYVVKLVFDKKKHSVKVHPALVMVDEKIQPDSATSEVVKKWVDIADQNFASLGFDPHEVVLASGDSLEGRESIVRSRNTNLTKLIVSAMEQAAPSADVAIVNAGSIRVDDVIHMPVTQYDLLRTLPFGGGIIEVDMKGKLLTRILETGRKNLGIGGFLHYSEKITYSQQGWMLGGSLIKPEQVIRVALTDFLITGGETNLGFLTKTNEDIVKVYPENKAVSDPRSDIRLAIIQYLKNKH